MTQLSQLPYPLPVLRRDEITCADELHEESHIVPCKQEHEREGHEISQGPPESYKYPEDCCRNEQRQRYRYQCAYGNTESADEHLVLYHLLEEDFRYYEKKGRRYDGHDEQRQKN